jgi:hypothetical protein
MAKAAYRSDILLAELRATASSSSTPASECGTCQLQHRVVCTHLTEEQYASLKATKRAIAHQGENKSLHLYECGHVYRDLCRIGRDARGPKQRTKGLCTECWRYVASDGRRMCVDHERGYSRPSYVSHKSKADDTRYKRRRGKFRVWRIRGPMVEKVQL